MVPTELAFFEVKKEFVFSDAMEFGETALSEAPEGFDTVDVVLAFGKFVLMVMNAMNGESRWSPSHRKLSSCRCKCRWLNARFH